VAILAMGITDCEEEFWRASSSLFIATRRGEGKKKKAPHSLQHNKLARIRKQAPHNTTALDSLPSLFSLRQHFVPRFTYCCQIRYVKDIDSCN